MAKDTKARNEAARPEQLAKHVRYPIGRFDLAYRLVDDAGALQKHIHTLMLLLSSDEARQMARHLNLLASEIEAMGGTRQ